MRAERRKVAFAITAAKLASHSYLPMTLRVSFSAAQSLHISDHTGTRIICVLVHQRAIPPQSVKSCISKAVAFVSIPVKTQRHSCTSGLSSEACELDAVKAFERPCESENIIHAGFKSVKTLHAPGSTAGCNATAVMHISSCGSSYLLPAVISLVRCVKSTVRYKEGGCASSQLQAMLTGTYAKSKAVGRAWISLSTSSSRGLHREHLFRAAFISPEFTWLHQ
eukprot:13375-Heterococcus_DN1.PRE.2